MRRIKKETMGKLKTHWYYYLFLLFAGILSILGSWWVYLMLNLSEKLAATEEQASVVNMIKWEGITFFILIVLISFLFLYIYFLDLKKTHSIQTFFSALTHELKTPLASIRLQSQVIESKLMTYNLPQKQKKELDVYISRLNDDTIKLESKLEETLQLSRLERGGELNLKEIELHKFVHSFLQNYPTSIKVNFSPPEQALNILADESALSMILKNLLDNTLKHNKEEQKEVNIRTNRENRSLTYHDNGKSFEGDLGKISQLFYKFESSKGTGIGLYLVSKLMQKMEGQLEITNDQSLNFTLFFRGARS